MLNCLKNTLGIGFFLLALFISPLQATFPLTLQKQADILREEGQSLQAINIYNQAIVGYQEEKDYHNMIEALTGRLLSWKHLFYKTEDKVYAIIVKKEAEAMIEIAKEYKIVDKEYLLHFLNGTADTLLNDYQAAEKELTLSVKLFPFDNAEKGDWIAHLGALIYFNGRKEEGKKMILDGVKTIQEKADQIDPFLFNVWVSGAYLRLSKLLKKDEPAQSQFYFDKAKEIIDSDNRLVIRKQQLESSK